MFETAKGDNSEIHSSLERILSTAVAFAEVSKDEVNGMDSKLTFYMSEFLQYTTQFFSRVLTI